MRSSRNRGNCANKNASYFGIEQGLKEGINQEKRSRSWECKLREAGGRDLQSLPTVQQIKTNKGEEKEKKRKMRVKLYGQTTGKKNKMAVMDRWLLPSPACFLLTFL